MKNKDRETFLLNKIERLEQSLSTVTEAKMTLDSKEKENRARIRVLESEYNTTSKSLFVKRNR